MLTAVAAALAVRCCRYGILVVATRQPQNFQENVTTFMAQIEADARACGMPIKAGGPPFTSSDNPAEIADKLATMKSKG